MGKRMAFPDNGAKFKLPKHYYLCETMTEEEMKYFMHSVYEYLMGNVEESDYWIAKVNRAAWPLSNQYRLAIDEFHERGAMHHAEQDH